MKKLFALLTITLFLLAGHGYAADLQVLDNGTNRGVATKVNFKGATVSRSGLTTTVDYSNLSGINWTNLPNVVQGINVNWASVNALGPVNNAGVNWTDLQTVDVNLNGINWYLASTAGNGINWYRAANGASSATIVCWKANGQPGKCGTGVSGTGCTACL